MTIGNAGLFGTVPPCLNMKLRGAFGMG